MTDDHPIADAGGPYADTEGNVVTLSGAGSTSPSAITDYAWDTDGDGNFDDATGVGPMVGFNQAFVGLIGLRVTNADGKTDTDYAPIQKAS